MPMCAARRRAAGFTLAELMIVLAIIGVLATLAVYGVQKYVLVAKTAEPIEIINSIRAAQEQYRDETFAYKNVSTGGINAYHPGAPNAGKRAWETGTAADNNWNEIGVRASAPVQFGYACVAGGAGNAVPALGITANLNFPSPPTSPWYVVKAAGDRDVDSVLAIFIGSSFTDEIHSEREDE
jgi:type IV pilus assembly protein PilA